MYQSEMRSTTEKLKVLQERRHFHINKTQRFILRKGVNTYVQGVYCTYCVHNVLFLHRLTKGLT